MKDTATNTSSNNNPFYITTLISTHFNPYKKQSQQRRRSSVSYHLYLPVGNYNNGNNGNNDYNNNGNNYNNINSKKLGKKYKLLILWPLPTVTRYFILFSMLISFFNWANLISLRCSAPSFVIHKFEIINLIFSPFLFSPSSLSNILLASTNLLTFGLFEESLTSMLGGTKKFSYTVIFMVLGVSILRQIIGFIFSRSTGWAIPILFFSDSLHECNQGLAPFLFCLLVLQSLSLEDKYILYYGDKHHTKITLRKITLQLFMCMLNYTQKNILWWSMTGLLTGFLTTIIIHIKQLKNNINNINSIHNNSNRNNNNINNNNFCSNLVNYVLSNNHNINKSKNDLNTQDLLLPKHFNTSPSSTLTNGINNFSSTLILISNNNNNNLLNYNFNNNNYNNSHYNNDHSNHYSNHHNRHHNNYNNSYYNNNNNNNNNKPNDNNNNNSSRVGKKIIQKQRVLKKVLKEFKKSFLVIIIALFFLLLANFVYTRPDFVKESTLNTVHPEDRFLISFLIMTAPRRGDPDFLLRTIESYLSNFPNKPEMESFYTRTQMIIYTHFTNHTMFDKARAIYSNNFKAQNYLKFHREEGLEINQRLHVSKALRLVAENFKTTYVALIEDDFPLCEDKWQELLTVVYNANVQVPRHCGIFVGTGGSGLIMKTRKVLVASDLLLDRLDVPPDILLQNCLLGEIKECEECSKTLVTSKTLLMYHLGYNTSTSPDRIYHKHEFQCGWRHPFNGDPNVVTI